MATRGRARKQRSSSDGCDFSWLEAWRNRLIFIGRSQSFAIGGTARSPDLHRMAAIFCDLGDARGAITIAWSPSNGGRFIGRWIFIDRAAEEHQCDRGAIAIRRPGCSRSFAHLSDASGWLDPHRTDDDRASTRLIGDDQDHPLTWSPSDGRRRMNKNHDRGAIVARWRRDRGPIMPRSWLLWGEIKPTIITVIVAIISTTWPHRMALKIGPKFPLKAMYSPFLFFNFWSIRGVN